MWRTTVSGCAREEEEIPYGENISWCQKTK